MAKRKKTEGREAGAPNVKERARKLARSLGKKEDREGEAEGPPDPEKDAGYYDKEGVFRRRE